MAVIRLPSIQTLIRLSALLKVDGKSNFRFSADAVRILEHKCTNLEHYAEHCS
jgi:hypothetical protein